MKKTLTVLLAALLVLSLPCFALAEGEEATAERAFMTLRMPLPEEWTTETVDLGNAALAMFMGVEDPEAMIVVGIDAGSSLVAKGLLQVYQKMTEDPGMIAELIGSVLGQGLAETGIDAEDMEAIKENMAYSLVGEGKDIRIRVEIAAGEQKIVAYIAFATDGQYLYELMPMVMDGGDETFATDVLDGLTFGEFVSLEEMDQAA